MSLEIPREITVYRVGSVDDISNGLFFTDNLDYYEHSITGYDKKDAEAYTLTFDGFKVWNPIEELDLEADTWSAIWGTVKDFEDNNIVYEFSDDYEEDEESDDNEDVWAFTDTDYLAEAGKDNGYDIVILEDIPSDQGYGRGYNEYVVFNKNAIRKLDKRNTNLNTKGNDMGESIYTNKEKTSQENDLMTCEDIEWFDNQEIQLEEDFVKECSKSKICMEDFNNDFDDFIKNAEVIIVDDAKSFDINKWEEDNAEEIDEELGCLTEKKEKEERFIKYKLDDESIKKVVDKIKTSELNIVDYWKTNQFLKKNNLQKEDLDDVIHNIEIEDYKTNSKPKDNEYNEAIIFVKNTKVKELGPFEMYIKLDYDRIEENPIIVISIHSHSKKESINTNNINEDLWGISDTRNNAMMSRWLKDKNILSSTVNKGPQYIVPNGDFVDVGKIEKTHRDIFIDFKNDEKIDEDQYDIRMYFENSVGWLRVNDGSTEVEPQTYVAIPKEKMTTEQYNSLLIWLDYVSRYKPSVLVVPANSTSRILGKTYSFDEYTTDDIIKKIKRYYTIGVLYEDTISNITEAETTTTMQNEIDDDDNVLSAAQSKFFKDSKIRNRNNRLLVCYHNTDVEFNVFDKEKIGSGNGGASFGKGFYFTPFEEIANDYGEIQKAYYLNIKKPFGYDNVNEIKDLFLHSNYEYDKEYVDSIEEGDLEDGDLIDNILDTALINEDPYEVFSTMVQNAGYDGIWAGDEIIAFEPNQIKLISNKEPTDSDNINEDIEIPTMHNQDTMYLPNPEYNLSMMKRYLPNYKLKTVSIDDIMRDTNNLENNSMKDRRENVWGLEPNKYQYKKDKGDIAYLTDPIRLEYKNGKYRVLDGNHRLRALANSGIKNVEVFVKEDLEESFDTIECDLIKILRRKSNNMNEKFKNDTLSTIIPKAINVSKETKKDCYVKYSNGQHIISIVNENLKKPSNAKYLIKYNNGNTKITKLEEDIILTEGTKYDEKAIKKLADSGLYDLDTSTKIVNALFREDIHAFVHSPSWLEKYLVGIVNMLIKYANGDRGRAETFLRECPSVFDSYLTYVKEVRPKIESDKDRIDFDNEFIDKMSFEDVKKKLEDIQAELDKESKDKLSKMDFKDSSSSYELVPIDSYEQFNSMFGGRATGDGSSDKYAGGGGTAWCHTNSKSTYDSWVDNGKNKFFVLANKDWKNIKFNSQSNSNNPKDDYGNSLIAILVKVRTGVLLKATLRCNHVGVNSNADNQYRTYAELSELAGFNVEEKVKEYLPEIETIDIKPFMKQFNGNQRSLDDILYRANIKRAELTTFVIPDSVTYISREAFSGCTSLTSVTIPNSVTHIGDFAFDCCKSLTEITIPNSVTQIGYGAFNYCKSLESVIIGNSVEIIGISAFHSCTALKSVTIPNSVIRIKDEAFASCKALTNITIGNSVTSIGKSAFSGCASLTSITIGKNVISIGSWAFGGCPNLTVKTNNRKVIDYCKENGIKYEPINTNESFVTKEELIYRGTSKNSNSLKGGAYGGLFFATNLDDASTYGKVKEFELDDNAKIYKGESSFLYCKENGLYELKDPMIKKISGMDTLKEVDESNEWEFYFVVSQYLARKDLESKGYDGAYWNNEDDTTPQQYQIWNKDKIKPNTIKESLNTYGDIKIWQEFENGIYMDIAYVGDNWIGDDDKIIKQNLRGYVEYEIDDKAIYIRMIAVAEKYRRLGIGTLLINDLKKRYPNKEIITTLRTDDGSKFFKKVLGE